MKRNQASREGLVEFEVDIEKLVYGGEGLARHEGKVVFVPFTAPGDRVAVREIERKKGFSRAALARILNHGPRRTGPVCPHFGRCGGCQWQHLDYALQVETKRKILEELFHHHFPETRSLEFGMKPCPSPYGYRSRARIQLQGSGSQSKVGFFQHRSHVVEDVSSCPLLREPLNAALGRVRAAHVGGQPDTVAKEVDMASAEDGTWAFATTDQAPRSDTHESREVLLRHAAGFLYATAASVFFQANDFMLDELITVATEATPGDGAALDLFSGVGFFSLPLARRYREVVAVESGPQAHQFCISNARQAGLDNIRAVCADVGDWIKAVGSVAAPAFDLILLDPPRTGAGREVMVRLAEWVPDTIVYVSCDPQTLCRDLAALPARDYRIDRVEGLDLFPQTYHMETVVHLKRR